MNRKDFVSLFERKISVGKSEELERVKGIEPSS